MKIAVRFYGIAYDYSAIREWSLEIKNDAVVMDLLRKIVEVFPALRDLVFDEKGVYMEYLVVSINNVDILGLDGVNTVLSEEDMVFVMPPIGGG